MVRHCDYYLLFYIYDYLIKYVNRKKVYGEFLIAISVLRSPQPRTSLANFFMYVAVVV